MTAYGQATSNVIQGRFVVEIQSLNRKHQEITVYVPPELSRFEAEIRRQISLKVSRGHITLKLSVSYNDNIPVKITPNVALAKELKAAWDQISDVLGLERNNSFKLSMLASRDDILAFEESLEDLSIYQKIIQEVVDQALRHFIDMKIFEGTILSNDIQKRIDKLKGWIEEIGGRSAQAPEKYREKLLTKLNELRPGIINEDDDRLLKEILLYSEKMDISEEITRFQSHIIQLENELNSQEFNVGKKLEFIMQEMGREINTIGSKSSDVVIAKLVVEVKSELERIREQIQNVE